MREIKLRDLRKHIVPGIYTSLGEVIRVTRVRDEVRILTSKGYEVILDEDALLALGGDRDEGNGGGHEGEEVQG